jgi:limonene-1,2-epoxide hydrolase
VIETEGGKIQATRHYFDLMTLLQQIGVMEQAEATA